MYKCNRCNREFESYESLRKHVSRVHKIHSTNFYVEYYLNGVWPICKCGCGKKVKWSYGTKSFREFCQGHQSRVHNNWGHNQKAIKNSSATRRKQFESGERNVWNDGLTKEIDDRVKNNGLQTSISINSNIEELKRRSVSMRQRRLDGSLPTLYGPNASRWKGGVSEINVIARNIKKLYDEWKYPILVRDGFKCVECGCTSDLHIHHNEETMSEIVKKHIVDGDIIDDFELKKSIADKVVDYHVNNNVSGITLCKKCHESYHPSLNFD